MAVKGVFTSDMNIQAAREGDFASALLQTMPTGTASLFALSAGMESEDARDTVVTWFEEGHISGYGTITNNAGTGTSIIVNDASIYVAGTTFVVPSSGEYIFVESVSGLTLTVARGIGSTSPSAIDGSSTPVPIQRITTAHEEGSARPTAIANLGTLRFNLTGIHRQAWDATGTAKAVAYHTGDVVAKNKRDALGMHAEDIERGMIWSVRSMGVLNGRPFRTSDGIRTQLSTNVQAQSTNVTWDDLDLFLRNVFAINIKNKPNERIGFCGNTVISVVNRIARYEGTIDIKVGQTDFGLEIHRWRTPYGSVSLMTHPLMNESPIWTKDLLVLHPGAMRVRYLRRTHEDNYDKDGTRGGVDGDYGVVTTEMCTVYKAEATGGYFSGIDTAAASS